MSKYKLTERKNPQNPQATPVNETIKFPYVSA
jgi:hypothetical protein